ncbi:hypothetical protein C8A01DRAFT_34083 [Parachaetomium inaequale]|uniref:Uncharacterized protein n=1 Tax=Parachaetomium inaequale TaxID=2588326 RepID=A0AAN6PJ47_9PEZI|nr:hypothetical protein C8A01DRAFT_34083 [Parachaetomium inaequale]
MAPFSQADAAAACLALSEQAQSMVSKAQQVLPLAPDDCRPLLSALPSALQQFSHRASFLGSRVADASVVDPELGKALETGLAEGQSALDVVSAGLEPEGDATRDGDAVAWYVSFVSAYMGFFDLGSQLLVMETEQEQESALASPVASGVLDAAHTSSEQVVATVLRKHELGH